MDDDGIYYLLFIIVTGVGWSTMMYVMIISITGFFLIRIEVSPAVQTRGRCYNEILIFVGLLLVLRLVTTLIMHVYN